MDESLLSVPNAISRLLRQNTFALTVARKSVLRRRRPPPPAWPWLFSETVILPPLGLYWGYLYLRQPIKNQS